MVNSDCLCVSDPSHNAVADYPASARCPACSRFGHGPFREAPRAGRLTTSLLLLMPTMSTLNSYGGE
eukprot:3865803-Amphidinium_carterae.1